MVVWCSDDSYLIVINNCYKDLSNPFYSLRPQKGYLKVHRYFVLVSLLSPSKKAPKAARFQVAQVDKDEEENQVENI